MSTSKSNGAQKPGGGEDGAAAKGGQPPPLARDELGRIEPASLADLIEWFLNNDPRVNMIRHPKVEEVFQWKQAESRRAGEEVYEFTNAEERLAIGIMQAIVENEGEPALHGWISQLLNALDDATKTNEEVSHAYRLDTGGEASTVGEAAKIPTERGRAIFLTCCWLEALCTAEVRVLGWVYQQLYGRPFQPGNY
jgi:predicted enzyme related to lactoylglutathione lyase